MQERHYSESSHTPGAGVHTHPDQRRNATQDLITPEMELIRVFVIVHVETRDPEAQRSQQETVDGEVD